MGDSSKAIQVCLADWDGTLRRDILAVDWVDHLATLGMFPRPIQAQLHVVMASYRAGSLPYEHLVTQVASLYALGMTGVSRECTTRVAHAFVRGDQHNLFPFVRSLLQYLRTHGIHVHIISGGPEEPLRAYAGLLPLSSVDALSLNVDGQSHYTGTIARNYGLVKWKRAAVRRIRQPHVDVVMALGNSTADKPLFDAARLCVWIRNDSEQSPEWTKRLLTANPTSGMNAVFDALDLELHQ